MVAWISALIAQIWRTLGLLVQVAVLGAAGAAARAAPYAAVYLWALGMTTFAWLVLILGFAIAKAVTGYAILGFIGGMLGAALALIVGVMWSPLAILVGSLIGVSHPVLVRSRHPYDVGVAYLNFIGTVLFWELLISIYIMMVPFHNNLAALPVAVISGVAIGVGTLLYGSWLTGRFYTSLAIVVFLATTLAFFFPQTFQILGARAGEADATIAGLLQAGLARVMLWIFVISLVALVAIGQIKKNSAYGTAALGILVAILLVFFADWYLFQGGMNKINSAWAGITIKPGKKDPPPPPASSGLRRPTAFDKTVRAGDVRLMHVPPDEPVTLEFPDGLAMIRQGSACFRDENAGRVRCEDARETMEKHGGRVPCFNGPLRLTILPTKVKPNVLKIEAGDNRLCDRQAS